MVIASKQQGSKQANKQEAYDERDHVISVAVNITKQALIVFNKL